MELESHWSQFHFKWKGATWTLRKIPPFVFLEKKEKERSIMMNKCVN